MFASLGLHATDEQLNTAKPVVDDPCDANYMHTLQKIAFRIEVLIIFYFKKF